MEEKFEFTDADAMSMLSFALGTDGEAFICASTRVGMSPVYGEIVEDFGKAIMRVAHMLRGGGETASAKDVEMVKAYCYWRGYLIQKGGDPVGQEAEEGGGA